MLDEAIQAFKYPLRKVGPPVWRRIQNAHVRGLSPDDRAPVVIYQMGKVGSTSLNYSLNQHGVWPVYQVHRVAPDHLKEIREHREKRGFEDPFPPVHQRGLKIYRQVVEPRRSAKFISLVRNPVDRNVSAFFYNFVGEEERYEDWSPEDLVDAFLEEYNHDVPLVWFQREPESTLQINVYDTPFPHDRGYVELCSGPFDLLVMRSELSDEQKEKAIQKFLGIADFQIKRRNVGREKNYVNAYETFKEQARLPRSYLDRMLQSQYAQHFYPDMIESTYDRWLGS